MKRYKVSVWIGFLLAAVHMTDRVGAQSTSHVAAANAFVDEVFSQGRSMLFSNASDAYLQVLGSLNQYVTGKDLEAVRHRIRLMAMVMDTADQEALGINTFLSDNTAPLPFGQSLVRWWRRQDPIPATPNNERLEEHLLRSAYARHKFFSPDDKRGFDDRGEVYIRFGPPERSLSVTLKTPELILDAMPWRIPNNIFWSYPDVHPDAHFLFVQHGRRNPYQLGISNDLIPRNLQGGRRNVNKLLYVMEEIYAQLAIGHPHYGDHYDRLTLFRTLPTTAPAHLFAERMVRHSHIVDDTHASVRETAVPRTHTSTVSLEHFPVEFRWARFLDKDSRTCTDIYWAPGNHAFKLRPRYVRRLRREGHDPSDNYLLSAAIVQRNAEHLPQSIIDSARLIRADSTHMLPASTITTCLEEETTGLVMQWQLQWIARALGDSLRLGTALKMTTASIESLIMLNSRGTLDMSDLKPMIGEPGTDQQSVYPWLALPPHRPLTLYFEIYNLTYGAEDVTNYTITYGIHSGEGGSRSVSTSYTGQTTRATESVTLDLNAAAKSDHVDIQVQVVDDVTGLSVKRSISFDLQR